MLSVEGTTQGHPLGLDFYTIGTQRKAIIEKLTGTAKQAWHADDFSASATL